MRAFVFLFGDHVSCCGPCQSTVKDLWCSYCALDVSGLIASFKTEVRMSTQVFAAPFADWYTTIVFFFFGL